MILDRARLAVFFIFIIYVKLCKLATDMKVAQIIPVQS